MNIVAHLEYLPPILVWNLPCEQVINIPAALPRVFKVKTLVQEKHNACFRGVARPHYNQLKGNN